MSEYFDELIFVNPSPEFEELVLSTFVEKRDKSEEVEQQPVQDTSEQMGKEVKLSSQSQASVIQPPSNSGLSLRENTEWNCKPCRLFSRSFDRAERVQWEVLRNVAR